MAMAFAAAVARPHVFAGRPCKAPCRRAAATAGSWQRRRGVVAQSAETTSTTTTAAALEAAAAAAGGKEGGAQPEEPPPPLSLKVSLASSMAEIKQEEWDACATGGPELNPFLLHDFLLALETSGSVTPEQGWLPQHVLVTDEATGQLLGACPCYMKGHSAGEYVFDSAWASAYERSGLGEYYPKLLIGVPFTPVPGPRLLLRPGPHAVAVRKALEGVLPDVSEQLGMSSLHINFPTAEDWESLGRRGYLQRTGLQFHWYNRQSQGGAPYTSFDGGEATSFLAALRQSKRKNIRQERKKAAVDGLRILRLTGADIKPHHWAAFYSFYRNTTARKMGSAYLTRAFFNQLGERMGDRVLLVVAETEEGAPGEGEPIAAALNLVGSHAIFGRNWGCKFGDRIPNLHFELCYYQALEHAIELGLDRVEAGAQGEHKIARGYIPHLTYSAHHIQHDGFRKMVERFLAQEREDMDYTLEVLRKEASPYKQLS